MKKVVSIIAMMTMVFFSCKKDHSASTSPSGKKYKVTFNVSNFIASQSSFAVRHGGSNLASDTITNLRGYLDVLYYVVYDQNGNVAAPVMQDSTMSNMGMITDSLPAGNYSINIVAGKKGLTITHSNSDLDGGYYLNYGGGPIWQDTFAGFAGFTVGSGPVSQSVTLHREVGELELKILDDMPATADSLFMAISPEPVGIPMQGDPVTEVLNGIASLAVAIPDSAKGKPNFMASMFAAPIQLGTGLLTIVCKDAAGNVLGSFKLGGTESENDAFWLQANQKIIMSGDLFTGATANSSQTFVTTVDTSWANTIRQGFSLRKNNFKIVATK